MSQANFPPQPSVIPPLHVMQPRTKHRTLTRPAKSAAVHYTVNRQNKPETLSHSKYRVGSNCTVFAFPTAVGSTKAEQKHVAVICLWTLIHHGESQIATWEQQKPTAVCWIAVQWSVIQLLYQLLRLKAKEIGQEYCERRIGSFIAGRCPVVSHSIRV
jgi:hypothetical protein